jgi:circadian clock protein KaiC
MHPDRSTSTVPELRRFLTHVPGLDTVLGGGLLIGDSYLIVGKPGTGKTSLGNQLAFAHAAAGGTVLYATLQTESHDRMLAHLHGFRFADHALVGERVHYVSLLGILQDGSFDDLMHMLLTTLRQHGASLLILDGAGTAHMLDRSTFDIGRFIHALQARTALLGCTTILLSGRREAADAATHVDGVIALSNKLTSTRDARSLRITKLRGSNYLGGRHALTIDDGGVTVYPRLEATHAGLEPSWHGPGGRVAFGVAGLDAMTGEGLSVGSSTMLIGPPGAGKSLLGLHFLMEGARQGEPGLIAGFEETASAMASTARGAGMDLEPHLDSGLVRVLWHSPLELTPDAWAVHLLAVVEEHQPRRLVIDAFGDLFPFFEAPGRASRFAAALANALRDRGVTTLFIVEVDTFAGPEVRVPVPHLSATMDNGILLRTVELESSLHRLVSILKQRETDYDRTIREFTINAHGMTVGDPFNATALLTGSAVPSSEA